MIIHPVTYHSSGGIGHYARTPVITVFTGNETVFVGFIVLFLGGFILVIARRIRTPNKANTSKSKKPNKPEMATPRKPSD
jgi:hypothetical protein